MTWFRVDDQLPDHRKVRRAGTSAMGLWLLAGAWSAGHLTDGWVPRDVALRYGTERQAAKLVEVGLWAEGVRDDESGWWFHQWTEHQPSGDQVRQRRKAAAERQAEARARKTALRHARESVRAPGVSHPNFAEDHELPDGPVSEDVAAQESESRRDSHVSHADSHALPDPTRPDPKDNQTSSGGPRKRATRIPADFDATPEMIAWARANTPLVGTAETERFRDYWTGEGGQRASKRDWIAAWRNWMRRAQDNAERQQTRAVARRPNADDTIRDLLAPTGSDGATILQLTRGDPQ